MESYKYWYQLSLADGRVLMQETDGFNVIEMQENGEEKKILVNSTALVQVKLVESEPEVVSVEPELVKEEVIQMKPSFGKKKKKK